MAVQNLALIFLYKALSVSSTTYEIGIHTQGTDENIVCQKDHNADSMINSC